jgi:quercetin dioxygenase-like cupin family protein
MNRNCERRDFVALAGGFAALSFLGNTGEIQQGSPRPFRRVVTGVTPSGRSTIVSDGRVPDTACFSRPEEYDGCNLWLEEVVPVNDLERPDPMAESTLPSWPPPGGVLVKTATYEAGFSYPMHRSETLDLVVVVAGQMELILEEDSTVLGPGDTVVQRGTNHAWRVVGDEPCTAVAVLLSAVS